MRKLDLEELKTFEPLLANTEVPYFNHKVRFPHFYLAKLIYLYPPEVGLEFTTLLLRVEIFGVDGLRGKLHQETITLNSLTAAN